MKKWTSWVALVVVFALLTACGDAGNYVKQTYPLVSADGNGSNLSKVYSAQGKTVPVVANELAQKEPPKEKSKESLDQMFLLYSDKVINIQKDPKDSNNTLVEVDSVQYAKEHYDSSFLQGFLAASLLQSVMGGGWFGNHRGNDYRGYTQTPTYRSSDSTQTVAPTVKKDTPSTSDRTGTFSTGKKSATSNSNIGSNSSGSDSTSRKNDGSTINRVTKPSSSKPATSSRSGSFSRRK
ncbi:DUF4247 domain-containing protein [Paenibacillus sp. GP183]|uniref:DUF4247 domain-containing protein n=1 Tax=Paenibacillus sp. GP183 TaxID=1882751 RepID=UPI000898E884|nr:DUF4247 domain-containing protein [Paenibacillus sp. GP183]SEB76875.1 protein of unknown function [Paenibacillus sp. GP183]